MWQLIVFGSLLAYASGQGACDFSEVLQPGQNVTVQSPNYPSSYPPSTTCRWIVSCPNATCRADCDVIAIPPSTDCSMDRLLISRTGDPQLNGADTFCGHGNTTVSSNGTQMSLGLITSSNSTGGNFRCTITSVSGTTPPQSCNCGYKKTNKIVGGTETGLNEYPMMAGLVDISTFTIFCGATIIDKKYLVTAAHCLANQNISKIAVVVGEHDVTIGTNATQVYVIGDYLIHPQYDSASPSNDYDIALIYVKDDIVFSDQVGPACLPFKFISTSFAGQYVTALGWGTTSFGGPTSDTLQEVDLRVITHLACLLSLHNPTQRQFCTFTPGKDTCQMDSGGPLLYTDPATGLLFNVGVISFGNFCAVGSGLNTLVSQFLTWIQDNTPLANYCHK